MSSSPSIGNHQELLTFASDERALLVDLGWKTLGRGLVFLFLLLFLRWDIRLSLSRILATW